MAEQINYAACGAALQRDIATGTTRRQKLCGFWYSTVARWLDASGNLTVRKASASILRLLVFLLIPASPIISKRFMPQPAQAGANLADTQLDPLTAPITRTEIVWVCILAVATGYTWWFDKIRKGKEVGALSKKKAGVLLEDSAGTIASLSSVLTVRAEVKTTNSEYRQHLQKILKRIHTEVSLLIDQREETFGEVVLLLYGNNDGKELQLVARSSDRKVTVKQIAAHKLMAHYVAQSGRDWIEHDFHRKDNTFPKNRVTTPGERAPYRSILFKPLLVEDDSGEAEQILCRGVLCIHSDRPYHFWGVAGSNGSSLDVILLRLQPYFALLGLVLANWPHSIRIESN